MDGTDVSENRETTLPAESGDIETATETAAPATTDAAPAVANGGGGDFDAASLMEQFLNDPSHDYKTLKYGDVMDGIIMHVDRDELLVDIGSKSEGVVPSREFSSLTNEEKQALAIGDTILVFVVQPENQEGHAVVSIDRARQEKSWRSLQDKYEANEVIEAEVTNYNKGGLLVNLDGVRGFVPASQVSEIRGGDEASKQADMARLIGTTLPLKVIEINRHRNRLILSERQAIQERRDVMKETLIKELKEGEIRKGRVSSICDFGAFVDIGGADGLVHLSELSWSRVRHPSEVLRVGQDVDVYVLGINSQEKKIALSIKRTQAEPWSRVATAYEVGQLVRGTVTQLANFGAFARIEDGIEGLVHVSELADERITHPKQVVSEGQELILRIIRIDPQRRRMGLSLRRALDTPDPELEAVFGPEILAERDQLVQKIRASLEAEGIEYGSGQPAPALTDSAPESASGEPVSSAPAADQTATAETFSPEAVVETTPEPEPAASAPAAAEAPAPRQQRERDRGSRGSRSATDLPIDLDGEPMSAMAMAFAMAGAQADLADEVAAAETAEGVEGGAEATADDATVASAETTAAESDTAPAEAVTAEPDADTAPAEPVAEAATAESDAETASTEPVAEAEAETSTESPSVLETVSNVAEAVKDKVTELVESVLPGGDDAAQSADAGEDAADERASAVTDAAETPVDDAGATAESDAQQRDDA